MPTSIELAQGDPALIVAIQRSRRLLGRKALLACAVGAVPLPGLDWVTDAALLSRLLPQISAEFGLAPTQLDRLASGQRAAVQKAATAVGAVLVGRLVTRDVLVLLARQAGFRMTTRQAAKYVPLAGQVVSAALGYTALRTLGELHIKECVQVARAAQLVLPAPAKIAASAESPKNNIPSGLGKVWNRVRP